mgnify:CR=1 FL=1
MGDVVEIMRVWRDLNDGSLNLQNGSTLDVGLGASLEYATSMDHFSIGVDVLARRAAGEAAHIGPAGIAPDLQSGAVAQHGERLVA